MALILTSPHSSKLFHTIFYLVLRLYHHRLISYPVMLFVNLYNISERLKVVLKESPGVLTDYQTFWECHELLQEYSLESAITLKQLMNIGTGNEKDKQQ